MELLSPDGYYGYLGIEKNSSNDSSSKPSTSTIDEDLVKKNYRRLSLKHHPDRPGGDAETFHALNRAQTVLMNTKLREQYDLLGLDLDEEDEHHHHKDEHQKDESSSSGDHTEPPGPTAADSIVSHIFTAALTGVMQLAVRTVMMGLVAVVVCRYRFTAYPALAVLAFIAYRVHVIAKAAHPGSASNKDLLSPALIAVGLFLMHQGRSLPDVPWSYMFWIGTFLTTGRRAPNDLLASSQLGSCCA